MKKWKKIERYFKGAANHRRLEILDLVFGRGGLSLEEIAEELECHIATVSEHTHRLVKAGLLNKNYKGRKVMHFLSPYGKLFVGFMKRF